MNSESRAPSHSKIASRARLSALALFLCLTACSAVNNPVDRPSSDDAQTIMRVKSVLIKNPEIDAAPVRVRIENEVVILDGFAKSEQSRQRIQSLVQDTVGDKKVLNRLELH